MFTLNNFSLCFLSPSSIPTFVFTRHKKKDFYFYSFKVVLIVRPLQQQYCSSKLFQSGDIESNPGPLLSFEELTSTLKENQNLLKIACLNVQSIQNIHDDITNFVHSFDTNTIFGFTETWLHEEHDVNLWAIDNRFKCFRQDRKTRGGGIMMLVPKQFHPGDELTSKNLTTI